MTSLKRKGVAPHFAVKRNPKKYFDVEYSRRSRVTPSSRQQVARHSRVTPSSRQQVARHSAGFSILELILVMFIVSLFAGLVSSTILKSYANNRLVETQSIVQTELNLAVDRLSRVLRSSTAILEATETNLKIRGYPSANDTAPSEINFYLQNSALKYSVIPPTGTAPNYAYSVNNAKYYTLVGKTSNSTANPAFRYYNDQNAVLTFPVSIASIKVVEPNLSALDTKNVLSNPIIVTTKITLRNFKTNL